MRSAPGIGEDDRVSHYLAGVADMPPSAFTVGWPAHAALVEPSMKLPAFRAALARWPRGEQIAATATVEDFRRFFRSYMKPISAAYEALGLSGTFLLRPGDNREAFEIPTFVKSRPVAGPLRSVIFRLDAGRHLEPVARVREVDIPFREKESRLVWRGATTGRFLGHPARRSARSFIPDWVDQHPRIDVGFSAIAGTAPKWDDELRARAEAAVRPRLTRAEQLRSRYLLSLEGNDVASGLKWMLASNSVVLMPRPTMETWACEGLLRPWVHYVPVRNDLSDLKRKLIWCETHPQECRQIVKASTAFMDSILDEEAGARIERRVVSEYAARVRLIDGGPEAAVA